MTDDTIIPVPPEWGERAYLNETAYRKMYDDSLADPIAFWRAQAKRIDWVKPFGKVCDFSKPPFAKWFVGGETNLCYNAVDRHLADRPDQNALIFVSTETETEKTYSFRELHAEVNRAAAMMQSLGVKRGDRVLIYMPMIAEAAFAMLAIAAAVAFIWWYSGSGERRDFVRRAEELPAHSTVLAVTAPITYVRFHGRNAAKWWRHEHAHERYDYLYTEGELAEWVPKIRELAEGRH